MGRPPIGGILQLPSNGTNNIKHQNQQQQTDNCGSGSNSSSDNNIGPTVVVAHNNGGLVALLHKEDDYGGHMRRPNEPIVKILRRPEHERTSPVVNDKPRQPVKTLQQREQEYAEARLRILGAAQSPEEEPNAVTSPTTVQQSATPLTSNNE